MSNRQSGKELYRCFSKTAYIAVAATIPTLSVIYRKFVAFLPRWFVNDSFLFEHLKTEINHGCLSVTVQSSGYT